MSQEKPTIPIVESREVSLTTIYLVAPASQEEIERGEAVDVGGGRYISPKRSAAITNVRMPEDRA